MSTPQSPIISLGEVLWDHFPGGIAFGGAPANFACHAALLGARVILASAVGNDPHGARAVEILEAYGIDTFLVERIADAATGSVGVSLDAAGKPTFSIHPDAAWDRIGSTPRLEEAIAGAAIVYFGTLGQRGEISRSTIRGALGLARERGIGRVLDVNLRRPFYDAALIRESVALASVLKLSDEELEEVAGACGIEMGTSPEATLRSLLGRYKLELVAMTRGAGGALLVTASETVDQPGIPTEVLDTVGAGDAFTAALVMGLLEGRAPAAIARAACQRASAVCAQHGAVPAPPASLEA